MLLVRLDGLSCTTFAFCNRAFNRYSAFNAVTCGMSAIAPFAGHSNAATRIRELREAALSDEHGHALSCAVANIANG